MSKDYDKIAAIEKAIADKYGASADTGEEGATNGNGTNSKLKTKNR